MKEIFDGLKFRQSEFFKVKCQFSEFNNSWLFLEDFVSVRSEILKISLFFRKVCTFHIFSSQLFFTHVHHQTGWNSDDSWAKDFENNHRFGPLWF